MGSACNFLFLLLTVLSGCADERQPFFAEQGFLDLAAWTFKKDEIVYLDGQWEFYWGRLLTPGDFSTGNVPAKTGYFPIPGYWNGYRVNGNPLAGDGYATFRLKIRLMPGDKRLALSIEDQSTAYRLWVNGSLVMGNGIVADRAGAMTPYRKISTAVLPAGAEYLDCVLRRDVFRKQDRFDSALL